MMLVGNDAAGATRELGRARTGLIVPLLLSASAVIVINALAWQIHLSLSAASVIDFLLVVVLSHRFGLWHATLASVAAVTCLDYFFVPPFFTFTMSDPQTWVTLAAFQVCSLFVSNLSAKAKTQARIATKERNETERLYDVSRMMLLFDRKSAPGPQVVNLISQTFKPNAIVLFDAATPRISSTGTATPQLEELARGVYFSDRDRFDGENNIWCAVLRLGSQPQGALAIKSADMSPRVANALASLSAIALERARSFEAESRALAGHETETLRSAVLDALAHEFKTPLTTILTASGGLLEDPLLTSSQRLLADLIDAQASHLSSLAKHLLKTAKLDSSEIKLNRSAVDLRSMIDEAIRTVGDRVFDRKITVAIDDEHVGALVDRDLMAMALSQLIDNAIKYSKPDTEITVRGSLTDGEIQISVHNLGSTIPKDARARIFERFYRVPGSEHRAGGSGIGLSVAKQIVEAHLGRIWVTSDGDNTVYTVALPSTRKGLT